MTVTKPSLRIVVGILAIAVLSFLLAPMVTGTGGDLHVQLAAQDEGEEGAETEPEPSTSDLLEAIPVQTTQVYLSRDPFRPVRPESASDGDGGTDGDGTGGTTDPTPDPTPTPGAGVEVVGVFESDSGEPMAIISFEGVLYTEGEGGTFADGQFSVVTIDLDTGCVDLTDAGAAFTACVGDGEVGGGDPDGGCSAGTSSASCEGIDVRLIDVTTDGGETAFVSVEGTVYEVGEGEVFAGSFQVVSIDDPCVRLLYGDDGFTLCVGDTVLK